MGRHGVALLFTIVSAASAGARWEASLNGTWPCQVTTDGKTSPQKSQAVPGELHGVDDQSARFERTFTLPAALRGRRIRIAFGGVKYNAAVSVNGKPLGGCFGGYRPFEVDATDAVRFGTANTLVVECGNWTAIMTDGPRTFGDGGADRVRQLPRDRVLAPIGGRFGTWGIWDDVVVRALPAVHVADVFVQPSVRRKRLLVEYVIANESEADAAVEVRPVVEDGGKDVLRLSASPVRVPAGKTVTVTVRRPWTEPRLWSHVDPHLYHLRTELSTGDVVRTRFGFRELWTEGPDFVLNGSKIHLLASSGWPPPRPQTREQMRDFFQALQKCGCIAFRTHTQPWRKDWYRVADEVGMLICVEGAIWNDDGVYRVNDPVFWRNYATHLNGMIDNHKNHPSVVMWSLENEFTGSRMNDKTPGPKAQLIRMGRLVKQWDPTRPVTYESDGDPGGVADVIGLHYPHEYPQYRCWPNEAYWLDKPWKGHGGGGFFFNDEPHFLWKRDKPLYIGEFLWLPSSNPSWHTVFFGDEAYIDYRRYRNKGKAESWKMAVLAYRSYGVSGLCPWTVVEGGKLDATNSLYQAHQYAYQKVAAYCHDYDCRFYGGESVVRRVEVFHDVMDAGKVDFRWTLALGKSVVDSGKQSFELAPAEQRKLKVTLRMPKVDVRTEAEWRLTLERGGERVFEDTHRYSVFPRRILPALDVALYDPAGTTGKVLKARPVQSLDALDDRMKVLVIGARAFKKKERAAPVIGRIAPERAALHRFVERGGRVLVLEQDVYPDGLFDLSLSREGSTMTFPLQADHPVLRGVKAEDLKFWRGDHGVSLGEPSRPTTGGWTPIVVSGSSAGIDRAPLLMQTVGRGYILFSQLRLIEKLETEPAANAILSNLLRYLRDYKAPAGRTAVLSGSAAYRDRLRDLGLRFGDSMPDNGLIICRGAVPDVAKLRAFVERGGRLLLHRPTQESFEAVRRAFDLELTLRPYGGPVRRAENDAPFVRSLAREDLYWLGEHKGIGWSATPAATDVADGTLSPALDAKAATAYEVEDWDIEGQIVEKRRDSVYFATVGSATGEVEFPETGDYVLGVVADGTPTDGVYPMASVRIDGRRLGIVSLTDGTLRTYTVFGRVEAGRRKVTVAFINDGSDPPREDRNLRVDKILVASCGLAKDVMFITSPPTTILVRRGKGVLVIDQLRWDTETRNGRKASRYAASLLTMLGGDFSPVLGVPVECETLKPKPEMPWYDNRGTWAYMGSNGHIEGPIEVAAAGRYTLAVVAGGTACQGLWPHIEVAIDGKKVGDVQLTSGGWRAYRVPVMLTAGAHDLKITFTNDKHVEGEGDVNLHLDKITFTRE
ncbi:hypothetical protein HQ560_13625 [bacterium]|nr:hypothetical protein [bacterium]